MHQRSGNRQSLDPLSAPFSANTLTRHPPNLFGVVLEKGTKEAIAKPINQEILKIPLLASRKYPNSQVRDTNTDNSPQTKIADRRQRQRDRVIKEPAKEIDARQSWSHEHVRIIAGYSAIAVFIRIGRDR